MDQVTPCPCTQRYCDCKVLRAREPWMMASTYKYPVNTDVFVKGKGVIIVVERLPAW